ncbi:MAG: aminotransferase class III-fold pyridoxal phosphate-dependent enzyme [Planctomycetota bacterium]
MPDLAADTFHADPRVAQAKQLIAEALADAQRPLAGVRPADPGRADAFSAMLEDFGKLRGKLWYPYIGSGIGRGPLVELMDGSVKYDMINGIGVHGLGHSDPALIAAGIDGAMGDTVMQGNLQANTDSIRLCDEMLKLANAHGAALDHCFLTTSGAMANENALKIIFQKHAPAYRIVAFSKCFTGRTLALASVTDKAAYRDGIPEALSVNYLPYVKLDDVDKSIESALKHLRLHLDRHKGKVAAVMFELVQGEGGYNAGDAKFHRALMTECKEQGLAVFVDEIQTFGRSLRPFAFQHYGLDEFVDVVSVGKMSQVCATLYKADYAPRPGLVSQTFTGSSPQIHAALEVLGRMKAENWFGDDGCNATIRAAFAKGIADLSAKHPDLIDGTLHGLGTMMAFQVFDGSADKTRATLNALYENGVIAFVCGGGPYRVRFLPPASVMTQKDVADVCGILGDTLVQVERELAQKQEA